MKYGCFLPILILVISCQQPKQKPALAVEYDTLASKMQKSNLNLFTDTTFAADYNTHAVYKNIITYCFDTLKQLNYVQNINNSDTVLMFQAFYQNNKPFKLSAYRYNKKNNDVLGDAAYYYKGDSLFYSKEEGNIPGLPFMLTELRTNYPKLFAEKINTY